MRIPLSSALVLLLLTTVGDAWAQPTILLTVLNEANAFGDVVLVRGDHIEVEFVVEDRLSETRRDDTIRLVRVSDGAVVQEKKRGRMLSGTLNLSTRHKHRTGALRVEFVAHSTGDVWASTSSPISVVADQAVLELTNRIGEFEATVAALAAIRPIPGPPGPQGEQGPAGPACGCDGDSDSADGALSDPAQPAESAPPADAEQPAP